MEASFTVELVAEQPGDFVGEITVKTELNVFNLSVSAKVLPAPEQQSPPP
jgi:CRISPR-associated protein Cas5t